MTAADMPAAEVDVDVPLVRALLDDQHPDLATLDIEPFANGWDNAVMRLGRELVVRLPRRQMAAELVANEQRWLPLLAPRLPLPIPTPVRVGVPACGYPWRWSVCPWFEGEVAALSPPTDEIAAASTLGAFLRALHMPAPPDAPRNPYRGVPLGDRSAVTEAWLAQLDGMIDGRAALDRWREVVALPQWPGTPVWLHGDMHPANLLVHRGALSAVIDFGDITSGDPATDLSVAWMLLSPAARPALRDAYGGVDEDTWARARGWALGLGVACLANSADNPVIAGIGRRTLAATLAAGA